jgi:inhibitor of cysteine peptidase
MRIALVFAAVVATAALTAGIACGGDSKSAAPTAAPTAVPTGGGYPDKLQLTDSDNGRTVQLARGGQVIVTLESNPSTGFSWYVAGMAGPELELAGEPRYVPPVSATPVTGASGAQVFTFRATGVGMPPAGTPAVVQVEIDYKRSFEPDVPPEKSFRFTVEIR